MGIILSNHDEGVRMKNGRCPRCSSGSIRKQQNGLHADGWKMRLHVWMNKDEERLTDVVTYLCVFCGYFENYLLDRENLSFAARRWTKVERTEGD